MPASRRVSDRQLELLLAFVVVNRDIALGRSSRGPQQSRMTQKAWATLANKLNAVADGTSKTGEQWRRYWVDWKAKTKAKGADIRRSALETDGGTSRLIPLTVLERRILKLIGPVRVESLPGVRIPFPAQSSLSRDPLSPTLPRPSQPLQRQPQSLPSHDPLSPTPLRLGQPSQLQPQSSLSHDLQSPSTQRPGQPSQSQSSPDDPPSPSPSHDPPSPSPPRQSPSQHSHATQRPRSRQRLIRNSDFPLWARRLEERKLAIQERHTRALEALSATLERRLANIDDSLREISDKLI